MIRGAGFFVALGALGGFFVGSMLKLAVWGTITGTVLGILATAIANWLWLQRR